MTFVLLSKVDAVFQLSGRTGPVLVPGIPRTGNWRLKIGDPLLLRRPDGSELATAIGGIEFTSPPNPDSIAVMLESGVDKEMVPIGTEIWASADRRGSE